MSARCIPFVFLLAACGGSSSDPDASEVDANEDADVPQCGQPMAITQLHEDTRNVNGGLAVQEGFLYWMSAGSAIGMGAISRLDLRTDEVTELATGEQWPWGIAIRGRSLYWINFADPMMSNGSVMTLSLLGGSPVALASAERPTGDVFVDDASIYFTVSGPDGIRRVPVNGGVASTAVTSDVQVGSPFVADGMMYWLEPATDRVMKRRLPDGTPAVVATSAAVGQRSTLIVAGGNVYWSTERSRGGTGMVLAVSVDGGTPTEIVPDQPFGVDNIDGTWLLVDQTHVYVATGHDGHDDGDNLDRIVRARRIGGAVETVAIATGTIRGFTMDDCNLYWVDGIFGAPRLMAAGK